MKTRVFCLRALILLLACLGGLSAQVVDLTPEQRRMLMQLSPEDQAKALELMNKTKDNTNQNSDVPSNVPQFPEVVKPREGGQDGTGQKDEAQVSAERQEAEPPHPKSLKPFGYDLFAGTPTTFAPATDIPVPAEYVVGPGDVIQVQLFGKENDEYSLPVSRDGTINFPGIGPVSVAGLRFPEVKKNLEQRVEQQLIGMRVSIGLGALRSIRIFILGDVQQPGSYTVSGLSTMTNALFVSGGVKLIGSLRNIQLKRQGRVITNLDLYDLLLRGDTRGDARLQPGDVIFVPPVGTTVGIDGEVKRPAIYELKNEKTFAEVLALTGGLLSTAYPEGALLERIDPQHNRVVMNMNLADSAAMATLVRNGDVLRVHSVLDKLENVVMLFGHVQRPGPYQWRAGMRLSELLPSVKVLLPKSDLDYIVIKRELAPDRRIKVMSVSLRMALAQPGSAADVELEPHDEVVVFNFTEGRGDAIEAMNAELRQQASKNQPLSVATVDGHVRFPGEYPLEEGMRVSDLLRAGGQLAEAAYTLQAELTRYESVNKGDFRETKFETIDLEKVVAGDASADVLLQPHDRLTIKELPQWAMQDTVKLSGEVLFPGTYPIRRGETLSAVLARAGGLTKFAYPAGAVFMREELQQREQEQISLMRRQLEDELNSLALQQAQQTDPQKVQSAGVLKDLSKHLENVKATGRLVIDLPAVVAGKSDAEVVLKDNDILVVPATMQEVTVIGEVFHPTSHLYQSTLGRDDYVNQSGGPTHKADEKRIYVVRANGAVLAGTASAWFGREPDDIKPGDTIVVPMDVDRLRPLTLWTSISQIAYQFGLAIAAWNTVGVLK